VVSFDAREPGTPSAVWAADPRLAPGALAEVDPRGHGPVVVLAAHPDDETLGAGALIATAAAAGLPVTVVVVTDGAASHPDSSTVDRAALRHLRLKEARAAVAELGPAVELVALDVPDGALREHRDEVRIRVAELVRDRRPGLLLAPWRGDGHRDHRVLGEIAAAVVAELETEPETEPAAEGGSPRSAAPRLLGYPIWMWHWADPQHRDVPWTDLVHARADEEARVAKQRALARYESQLRPLSAAPGDEAVLRPDFVEHFARDEVLVVEPMTSAAHDPAAVAHDPADPARFDGAHARRADPWGVTTRWYERRKRSLVLASLPDERYGAVLEIGCSIGVVTAELADRADRVLALDVSPVAVDRARARLADREHVRVEQADVSEGLPEGRWDLVVIGEVGYYLEPAALAALLSSVAAALTPGGAVVACHWRHDEGDFAQSGDAVHAALAAEAERSGLTRVVQHVETDFLLDVVSRDGRSIAERTGLR
jgi:LmbE family N-acetylglucosaminyl deacetylase/SAM-dependent methyltransferase